MRVTEVASQHVTTRYFHANHLGSIPVITNDAGAVVERLSDDAWSKRCHPKGAILLREAAAPNIPPPQASANSTREVGGIRDTRFSARAQPCAATPWVRHAPLGRPEVMCTGSRSSVADCRKFPVSSRKLLLSRLGKLFDGHPIVSSQDLCCPL